MLAANPIAFRMAASRFATGVAVVTAVDAQDETCGMTVNSFVTVSLSPPTVLVSVRPGRVHRAICASRRYAVNVLPQQAAALSAHFAGSPDPDIRPRYQVEDGLPRLDDCVAFFACRVVRDLDVSDHTLFIGEVMQCSHSDSVPLVFFSSRYHLGPGRPFGDNA